MVVLDLEIYAVFSVIFLILSWSQYRMNRDFRKHEKEGAVNRARLDELENLFK